jgi:hypothetical protein
VTVGGYQDKLRSMVFKGESSSTLDSHYNCWQFTDYVRKFRGYSSMFLDSLS